VSAPALVRAGAILDRRDVEGQRLLRACVEERAFDVKEGPGPHLPDFPAFAEAVLGWSFSPKGYAGTAECPIPPELEAPLPDYGVADMVQTAGRPICTALRLLLSQPRLLGVLVPAFLSKTPRDSDCAMRRRST